MIRPIPRPFWGHPRQPFGPPQWHHQQSFNWIPEPALHIYVPNTINATIKLSPHLASLEGRTDNWVLLESIQFPALRAKALEAANALSPRVTDFEQIKLTWCPRFPNAKTGYPAIELEDEIEVTPSNFRELILAAERQFCGGSLPNPPNAVEEIVVSFIVRWRPEMLHTAVPLPAPAPDSPASAPAPPPTLRIASKSSPCHSHLPFVRYLLNP